MNAKRVVPSVSRLPILIAGAGPTGLTLAHSLAAYGVPFHLIDKKSGPSRDSKALAINVLSQYQFALIGQQAALGGDAPRLKRANVFWRGGRLNAVDFRRLDFPIASFISQPQADTERQLIAALPSTVELAWQTELVELQESTDRVTARLRLPNGQERVGDYGYVVGCEGKNSVVRQTMGSKLEGWDYPMHFLLGDFELGWARPTDQAYYFVFDETFFVVVPIGQRWWRVVAKRDGELPQQTDASQLTELVSRYLGPELIQGPPRWFSGAPFYMRVATQLQTRRSFIAGDAAHLFSPIGGTGMNTGMQDAFNLAWKLAYVLHDHAPESLLASYSEERLPAIHQAAAAADAATRLISRLETAPERIAPLLPSLHRRSLLRVLPIKQAGIDLQYGASSALSAEQRPGGLTVGSLCRGLLDLRKFGHSAENKLACQVLLFLTKSSRQAAVGEVAALARELSAYGPRPLVLSVVGLDDAGANPNVAALLRRMAASDGELVVVRPDGIIACAATLLDRRPLHALLARWFGKQPATLGSWSQSSTEA